MSDTGIPPELDAKDIAAEIFDTLSADISIDIPEIDLADPKYDFTENPDDPINAVISRLQNEDLTSGDFKGDGTFDALMRTYTNHLKQEYDKGRITGAEYANAYMQITAQAMSQAVQYLLGRDQAYWSAMQVQQQAKQAQVSRVIALVQLAQAKTELSIMATRAEMSKAEYALAKMNLANADAQHENLRLSHDIESYKLESILPLEAVNISRQGDMLTTQVAQVEFQTNFLLPKQLEQADAQIRLTEGQVQKMTAEVEMAEFQVSTVLPAEVTNIQANASLTQARITLTDVERTKALYEVNTFMPAQVSNLNAQLQLVTSQVAKSGKEVDVLDYTLTYMMPAQREQLLAQTVQVGVQTSKIEADRDVSIYQTAFTLPAQVRGIEADTNVKTITANSLLPAQVEGVEAETLVKNYTREFILPAQLTVTRETAEAKRAETLNTRSDGAVVAGSVGRQKELYAQQITSFQRDAEVKAARIFTDAWVTQKSLDDTLTAPTAFQNASVQEVLSKLKTNNGLF